MSDLSDVLEPGISLYARVKRREFKKLLSGEALQVIFREAPGAPYIAILCIQENPLLTEKYKIRGYEVLTCPAPKPFWQKMKRTGATNIHKFRTEAGDVIYVLVMREKEYQEMQQLKKRRKIDEG